MPKLDSEARPGHHSGPLVEWVCSFQASHFTLVKEALIEIGCVVTSLVVGWLVVTRVHCGQMVHPRPIVTIEH